MKKIILFSKLKKKNFVTVIVGMIFGFVLISFAYQTVYFFIQKNVKSSLSSQNFNKVQDVFAGGTSSTANNIICTSFNCGTGKCGVVCCGPSNSESKKTSCKVYTEDQWKDSVLF